MYDGYAISVQVSTMSLEELSQKIKDLENVVHKQNEVIANTGRQLMEIQVKDVKTKMFKQESQPKPIDTEDFVTNEDIVQLVGELQSQLDYLEDRTMKRGFNSHISESSELSAKIAPLCNRFGEPAPEIYPETLEQLNKISPVDLVQLAEYYELIIENEPDQELAEIVKGDTLTKEDAEKLLGPSKLDKTLAEKVELFTKEDLDALFDEFARYIGVRVRRGDGW